MLRSGTSIGALIRESENASTSKDFIYKLTIALKEADETDYWLTLLFHSQYIDEKMFHSIKPNCSELIKMLIASVKTSKSTAHDSPL